MTSLDFIYFDYYCLIPSQKNAVENTFEEVCAYGVSAFISSVIGFALLFFTAFTIQHLLEGIVFAICFTPLRRYTGGYHAKSYLVCKSIFIASFLICVGTSELLTAYPENSKVFCIILLLLDFLVILCYAPVENVNKPLTQRQILKFHKKANLLGAIQVMIGFLFILFEIPSGATIVTTTTIVTVSIVVEILKQRRNQNEQGDGESLQPHGKDGY